MKKLKIDKIKSKIINYLEEILFILAFVILDIAMFLVGTVAGLITLSIVLFIIGAYITYIKLKGGLKIK